MFKGEIPIASFSFKPENKNIFLLGRHSSSDVCIKEKGVSLY